MKILLAILLITAFCYSTFITNCTTISTSGSYVLDRDLAGAPSTVYYGANPVSIYDYCLRINVSDVILDCNNHSISTNALVSFHGILIQGAEDMRSNQSISNISINNCRVRGYVNSIIVGQSNNVSIDRLISDRESYGVFIFKSNFVNVSNSVVNNASKSGVYMYQSLGNVILSNNTVLGGVPSSFYNSVTVPFFLYGYYINGENNTLVNNSAIDTPGIGFNFENISNNRIISNSAIRNNGTGFIILTGANVSFEGNNASGNDVGIYVRDGDRFLVERNVVLNSFSDGIGFDYLSDSEVSNNFIYSVAGEGFGLRSSSNIYVINQSVINSSYTGSITGFSSNITFQGGMYCYNRYYLGGIPFPTGDFQYTNSSNLKIENITCSHSYPEGLCSNSCPPLPNETEIQKPKEKNSACCLSSFLIFILTSAVFLSNIKHNQKHG